MTSYRKLKTTRQGKEFIMYYKDRRLTSPKKVPQEVIDYPEFDVTFNLDEAPETVDVVEVVETTPIRECIFCGEAGIRSKFINSETLYLCDEHYLTMSTGKIVAFLNQRETSIVG